MLIVCCSDISDPNWQWIAGHFPAQQARFEFFSCAPRNWIERKFRFLNLARLRGSFAAAWRARQADADVLVTHGPTLAAWCGIFALLLRLRARLIAHSFNFVELPDPTKSRVFALALRRADTLVVFSHAEIETYARQFRLPADRFSFVYWGVQKPDVADRPAGAAAPYLSAIGGNARDYRTLLEAACLLPDIPFVLIVRPTSLAGLTVPPNVAVHVNLPLGQTMRWLADSRFMVLPLNSAEVPCGHVTIVAAMRLGKTLIATASAGIEDYVHDGADGLTVPYGSPADLAAAIQRLWTDDALRQSLESDALRFASTHCTEDNIASHFKRLLLGKA